MHIWNELILSAFHVLFEPVYSKLRIFSHFYDLYTIYIYIRVI